MSDDAESEELVDFMDHPKIQADGVADIYSTNGRTYLVLFEFRKYSGKMRRLVVGEVVLPTSATQQWVKPPIEGDEDAAHTGTKH